MKKAFVDKAVAINDISDRHISIEEMEKAFEEGFKKGLNIEFKPLTLSDEQIKEVKELEEKYRSDEWLYKIKIIGWLIFGHPMIFLFSISFYIFLLLFYIYVDLQLRKEIVY